MEKTLLVLVLAVIASGYVAECYKILVVFPMPGKSHTILGNGVVRHLINAGHEVTYITPIPIEKSTPNLRQIDVNENFGLLPKDILNLKTFLTKENAMSMMNGLNIMTEVHNRTFHNKDVQKLLKDPKETFDVVVAEWMFSELYSIFSAIFDAPHVWISTVEPHWMVLRLIDDMTNPAYTADSNSLKTPPFTFLERVEQLVYQIGAYLLKEFYIKRIELQVYESLKPLINQRGKEAPDFEVLKYNASLILGNSHVSMGTAMSLPQSYKPIGGYHIDTNVKPLPKDLQKLLDESKNGLIYFSMGSNLKSKDLPEEVQRDLLKMFGTLKQTVLWKFEETSLPLPPNVRVVQWAPQPSILAHPKCVLFITHGGLLSTTETIHFAKPIIGIPVFADQFVNVQRAVKKGFALKVDLSYDLADNLKIALDKILGDPSYTKKVEELSSIYHDRPASPGAELVHWVEHVVRTGGATHLRSPALYVPFYQKWYLDLFAVILAALYAIKKVVVFLYGCVFKKKVQVERKKKRN